MLLMLTTFLILTIIFLVQIDRLIRPTLKAICMEECRAFASRLIGKSIQETLIESPYDQSDFAMLLKNEEGDITALETNSVNVNVLQTQLLIGINEDLDKSRDAEIDVSLGTASGVWLFAGRGPSVPMRFLPIGSADVKLISTFESAGINQTCHKLVIVVNTHVAGAIPFCKTETDIKYEYILAETILIGDVPEGYASIGG